MSKKLLFNFNREVIQNYTYVKYVGAIITATNTLEKPIKSAILTGSTKYRDIDTGEILETFEKGRNLELVSVKMPVLTTAGKNLFDEKLENNRDIDGNTGVVLNGVRTIPINFISVEPNTSYTLTRPVATMNVGIRYYSKSQDYLSLQTFPGYTGKFSATFSTPSDCYFIKFIDEANTLEKGYQIEQGTQATSYQPYQTNILTVNEDVTLCGIGDVQDELNLLTGEVIERIKTTTLDKFSKWNVHQNVSEGFSHFTTNITDISKIPHVLICDSLPAGNISGVYNGTSEGLYHNGNKYLHITIKTDKLSENNVNGLNQYLKNNIITFQYPLAENSIKTVDLSILDQNGNKVSSISSFNDTTHITASSGTIPPIFEGYLATKEG